MIEKVRILVNDILGNEESGHGLDHINRVLNLAVKFAKCENADEEIVSLIALLHDVDDYKLFGLEQSENLTNAKKIMNEVNVPQDKQEIVLESIKTMGYSKCLKGIRPKHLEGKIVSDADMCDIVGVNGILRSYAFSIKHGNPFFNKEVFPDSELNADKYMSKYASSAINHLFDKSLKIKKLMLTESGKKEIEHRHQITVDILYQFFQEESVPEWKEYLDKYLEENYK